MANDPKSKPDIDDAPIAGSEPVITESGTDTPVDTPLVEDVPPIGPPMPDVSATEPDDELPVEDARPRVEDHPPEAAAEPVAAAQPAPARGGFGAALLGGVAAAVIGFVAGKAGALDPILPADWRQPDYSTQLATLENRLSDQTAEIAALRDQLGAVKMPDIAPLGTRIESLAGELEPLADKMTALTSAQSDLQSRIDELEKRPISEGVSQSAIDAYERELTRMKESLEAQRAEVDNYISQARSMEAEADQSRQLATQRNALTRLQTALTEGAPYAEQLDALRAAGLDVPAPLADSAETGVPTLAVLRAAFPDAAREALAAAREASKGDTPGFSAFLARQFGARSVEPRAGNDPDAILSRAEAAVTEGRIDTALTELDALPDVAKAPLADWIAQAQRRQAAMNAADTLAQSLTSK